MKNHKFLVYFTHPYLTLPVSNLQKKKKTLNCAYIPPSQIFHSTSAIYLQVHSGSLSHKSPPIGTLILEKIDHSYLSY